MNVLSDEKTFLKKYHLDEVEYNWTGLKWEQLSSIYEAYLKEIPQYRALENYFTDCLRNVANVHSVITRLKEPERLIETLIRKRMANKELEVNSKNYNEIVTDLLEIRVLHLFKDDWESIHEYITNKWNLKEKPIAYARAGDDREADGGDLLERFQEKGCNLQFHELGYRSILYLAISSIDNKTNYVTILSRTVFEEGWNSIDHVIRDSHDIDNPVLMQYLSHFSHRIADMADEMGLFLHKFLNEEQESASKARKEPEREHYPEEFKPVSKSEENEKAPSEDARIALASAPQQESPASLTNLLKKRETPPDVRQDEHPKKSEGLPGTYQANLPEQQPAPPVEPAPPAALGLTAVPGPRPPVHRILAGRAESPNAEESMPGPGTHPVGCPPEGWARSDTAQARLARSAEADGAGQEQPDESFKIQPGILKALRNDNLKEQENGQKFTLSKLKQAIQGITTKNAHNMQQANVSTQGSGVGSQEQE